jgi:hypothetical protein
MYRESELKFSEFVDRDRFELSTYLSHLFHQFHDKVSNQPKDKKVKNHQYKNSIKVHLNH